MPQTVMCYVARKACGCVVAAIIDDAEDQMDVKAARQTIGKTLDLWARQGLKPDRVAAGDVLLEWFTLCPHVPRQKRLDDGVTSVTISSGDRSVTLGPGVVEAAAKMMDLGATIDDHGVVTNPATGERIQLP